MYSEYVLQLCEVFSRYVYTCIFSSGLATMGYYKGPLAHPAIERQKERGEGGDLKRKRKEERGATKEEKKGERGEKSEEEKKRKGERELKKKKGGSGREL